MSKLLRITSTLVIFGFLSIYTIRLVGSAQANGTEPPFTTAGGVPSLLGIQPGMTSYRDAVQMLQSSGFTHLVGPEQVGDMFSLGLMRVILTQSYSGDQVARITLVATQSTDWGSFGQIVALLGPPEGLVVQPQFTQSFWHRGQLEFVHGHRVTGFVSVDDPLESMSINTQSGEIPDNAVAWKGFASVEASLMTKNQ